MKEYAGKMSGGEKAGVKSGLSESGSLAGYSPEQCGMGTVGPDQKPQPTPRDKVGKFGFR